MARIAISLVNIKTKRRITIRCTRSRGPRGFFCLQDFRRGPVIVDVITLKATMPYFNEYREVGTNKTHSYCSAGEQSYEYALGAKYFMPVPAGEAWCYDCNTVVNAESPTSTESLERFKKILTGMAGRTRKPEEPWYESPSDLEIEQWRVEIDKGIDRLKMRTTPPRCLVCMGQSVMPIPVADPAGYTTIPDGPTLELGTYGFASVRLGERVTLKLDGTLNED